MRKILFLVFTFVLYANFAFGAPLVLKITNEVAAGGEIVRFDVSKYKKVLIGAKFVSDDVKIKEDRDDRYIRMYAVEDSDLFFMGTLGVSKSQPARADSVESLPGKISFVAEKAGVYKIYIWAE